MVRKLNKLCKCLPISLARLSVLYGLRSMIPWVFYSVSVRRFQQAFISCIWYIYGTSGSLCALARYMYKYIVHAPTAISHHHHHPRPLSFGFLVCLSSSLVPKYACVSHWTTFNVEQTHLLSILSRDGSLQVRYFPRYRPG